VAVVAVDRSTLVVRGVVRGTEKRFVRPGLERRRRSIARARLGRGPSVTVGRETRDVVVSHRHDRRAARETSGVPSRVCTVQSGSVASRRRFRGERLVSFRLLARVVDRSVFARRSFRIVRPGVGGELTSLQGTRAVAHVARRRADGHQSRSQRSATSRPRRRVAASHGRPDPESAERVERVDARAAVNPFPIVDLGVPLLPVSGERTGSGEGEDEISRGREDRARRSGVKASAPLSCARRPLASEACHPRCTRVRKCLGCGKRSSFFFRGVDDFGQAGAFPINSDAFDRKRGQTPIDNRSTSRFTRTGSRSRLARHSRRRAISFARASSSSALPARTDSGWRPRRPRSGRASPSRGARRAASRARDARRASHPALPTTTRPRWTCPRMRSATRRGTR